ncbi:MAG: hypothetical protein COA57_03050 [Flavobacteriales bacterium]|nr:MAG: hypothetical protein COA57_03050 [Flavobacteriales bacterium]
MKKKMTKIVTAFVSGYVLFASIGYFGIEEKQQNQSANFFISSNSWDFSFENSNYASRKMKVTDAHGQSSYTVDQKYEKVATMASRTDEFDQDAETLKGYIKELKALVQFEQNSGVDDRRLLQLGIGVHPDDFDELVNRLKDIGELKSFRSDVLDKTNEFNQLRAKRETLMKHKESLEGIKGKSGKIEEMINLEIKILDVQRQLQGLGVSLGDFDEENEFCTVKFTLTEHVSIVKKLGPWAKLLKAMEWATLYYFLFLLLLTLFCLSAFLATKGINEFKILKGVYSKLKD